MNCFQKKLQTFVTEFERAGRRVYESKEVSRLDIEVLQDKMRKMYDFLLSSDFDKSEEEIFTPKTEKIETKEEKIETPKEISKTQIRSSEMPKEIAPIEIEEVELVTEPLEVVEIETKEPEIPQQIEPLQEQEETISEPIVQEEIPIEEPKEQIPEPTPAPEPIEEEKPQEQMPKEHAGEEKRSRSSVLSYLHNNIMKDGEEKHRVEPTTLDLFSEKPQSIAEQFENRNRSDLRTAIGVSEKFMFINDLFSGNLKEYTDFINQLNDMTSWESSKQVIEQTKQRKKWASASLAYTTLENLIQRRFNR